MGIGRVSACSAPLCGFRTLILHALRRNRTEVLRRAKCAKKILFGFAQMLSSGQAERHVQDTRFCGVTSAGRGSVCDDSPAVGIAASNGGVAAEHRDRNRAVAASKAVAISRAVATSRPTPGSRPSRALRHSPRSAAASISCGSTSSSTDRKGQPVVDLKETDFQVLEDGKPQKVEQFKIVKIDGQSGAARRRAAEADSLSDRRRDRSAAGRRAVVRVLPGRLSRARLERRHGPSAVDQIHRDSGSTRRHAGGDVSADVRPRI